MPEMKKHEGLTTAELKRLLPNRYPYLLVDRITELVPGERARGYKNLTANEWYFPVHFPEEPMMPGMLQAEALLQTLTLTVLAMEGNAGKIVRGVSADKLKLKKRVVPGKQMVIDATLTSWDGEKGKGFAQGMIDGGVLACSAEFEFCLLDPKEQRGEKA